MFKLFNKSVKELQKKTVSFVNYLGFNSFCNFKRITHKEEINLYLSNSTLRKAIKMKADLGASLKPIVRNRQTKEIINKEHEVLKLLSNPSFAVSFSEFMKQIIINYEITANNFNLVTFGITRGNKPLEIYNISPVEMSELYGNNGKVLKYLRTITIENEQNVKKSQIEYLRTDVNPIFKDEKGNQIWHTRDYNPLSDTVSGKSKVMTLHDEINGIIKVLRHNLKLVENGCSPTALLVSKNKLTDEEYKEFSERFRANFTGENKAGKIQFLEGDLEYHETHISPRDMDWINGCMYLDRRIYELYGIPRALIDEKASTFNNLMQAKAQLYEFEIFPLLDKIYGELTDLLMGYYGESNLEIYYSKENIPSLDAIKIESTVNKAKTGIFLIDELREQNGLKPLPNGAGQILAGMKIMTSNQNSNEEETNNEKQIFIDLMKKDGYKKKQIDLIIKEYEKEGLF